MYLAITDTDLRRTITEEEHAAISRGERSLDATKIPHTSHQLFLEAKSSLSEDGWIFDPQGSLHWAPWSDLREEHAFSLLCILGALPGQWQYRAEIGTSSQGKSSTVEFINKCGERQDPETVTESEMQRMLGVELYDAVVARVQEVLGPWE